MGPFAETPYIIIVNRIGKSNKFAIARDMLKGNFELVSSPLEHAPAEEDHVTVSFSESEVESGDFSRESDVCHDRIQDGDSSVWGATANLVNCIVGAGIIGIPAAVQQCGFVFGAVCLMSVAYLLCQSANILIKCGLKMNKNNLETLTERLLGAPGYYLATVNMMAFAYGGMTAYMVILGDTLPHVVSTFIHNDVMCSREILVALSATFIMLPICLMKSLSSLAWASAISVVADIILVCIILGAGPAEAKRQHIEFDTSEFTFVQSGLFAGLGLYLILLN